MDAKQLVELGQKLLSDKESLNFLWQEIADNFYPERAEFTITRPLGTDFAANLMTSYPVLCRRDLGNQFTTMLRPTAKPWFHPSIKFIDRDGLDNETKKCLEWMEETQRRAMYDPMASFTRATKEGDHDFAAFGQCALSVELNSKADTLLYRCWHLRDMAWQENQDGKIGFVVRRWKPTAQTVCRTFKNSTLHKEITDANRVNPFTEVNIVHIVCDAEMYDGPANGRARYSIWYDVDHHQLIQADAIWGRHYIIPRWQTVSDKAYSYSPAVVAALPDARLIQAMTFTLLEAGEKATNPPMVATIDAVRSDVSVYAGGITWVSDEYDERTGEALRPIAQDFRGFNYGVQMNQDIRQMIHKAFFLDTLTMPERGGPAETAYEVGQRVQEYIRNALPLFEPVESEYNAAICDETFDLMSRHGGFGSPDMWPKKLRGADIDFTFESPLHDAIEEQKGQKFLQFQQLMAPALQMDPSLAALPKAETALRDALHGYGVPSTWLNDEDVVDAARQAQAANQQKQETLANLEQASNVVSNVTPAIQAAKGAGAGAIGNPGAAAPPA